MKNTIRICATLFALIVAASCTKEVANTKVSGKDVVLVPYTINASIADSKATISGFDVFWQEGDKIAVYDGSGKREFTLTSGAGTKTASFQGMIDAAATTLSATAPYSAAGDNAGQYTVPAIQTISSGAVVDAAALVMVTETVAIGGPIAFNHPCGAAQITVPAGTDSVLIYSAAASTKIKFAEAPEAETTAYVVLAAGDYEKLLVGVKTTDGTFVKTSGNTLTIAASKIIQLGKVKGTAGVIIRNGDELKSFLESEDKPDAYVVNDLDLSGVELTDTANVYATFDGRGHSLKNWTSAGKSLFKKNFGTIDNVVLDESCSLGFDSIIDGRFGFLVCESSGVVSNCINCADITYSGAMGTPFFGALIGNAEGASVKVIGCINNGDITINASSTHTGTMYLGGVSGRVATKGAVIKDCSNFGNINYNVAVKTTNNLYYGGVTGSINSGATAEGCENTGDVIFNTADGGAAVVIGGAIGYTAGNVSDCSNEGNVKYLSQAGIKGTMVGGVSGYASEVFSGCSNKGDVVVIGKTHEGRNTIGNLSVDTQTAANSKATSTATLHVGGILGEGAPTNAKATHFAMSGCVNEGNVSYTLETPSLCTTDPASAGRHCVAGIVGDASGPLTDCVNKGNVSAEMLGEEYTAKTAGNTLYVGGIAGSNYYSIPQTELTITNCSNSGDVYVKSVNKHVTNHTAGGIVGWPGKEGSCTSVTKKCTNTGNVTVVGNINCRMGGIQGGSGRIEECDNSGTITCSSSAASAAGGIAGFHSGGYQLKTCNNYGDVISSVASTGGISGFVGNAGNATMTIGQSCVVHCNVTVPTETTAYGFLIGKFNGHTDPAKLAAVTIGTSDDKIHVKGIVNLGDTPVTVSQLSHLYGNVATYSDSKHIFNFVIDD